MASAFQQFAVDCFTIRSRTFSETTNQTVFLAVLWSIAFIIVHYAEKTFGIYQSLTGRAQRVEWTSRLISTAHAIVATAGAGYTLYYEGPELFASPVYKWSVAAEFWLTLTVSYFVYDFIFVLIFYNYFGGYQLVIHHLVGIFSYAACMNLRVCPVLCLMFNFTECSTPFVNQHWFFNTQRQSSSQKGPSIWFVLNGMMMFLCFLVVRIPLSPLIAWRLLSAWDDVNSLHFLLKAFMFSQWLLITILNYYWFYRISLGMLRSLNVLASSGRRRASSVDRDLARVTDTKDQ